MRPLRRAYLDWLRGVAVLCMIEWHVLDAWTVVAGRDSAAWSVVTIIGGMAAPLFLFLAGVSVPFAIGAHVSRGATARRAAWLVQRRGWQVFGLAHVFRLQSFLLNPNGTWSGVLKPDILNILGLGLAGTAWLTGRGGARGRRVWWLLLPAAIVLVLTPLSRIWWWPTLLHPRLEAYIRPSVYGVFALFPWVAYVPVGAFVGSLIAEPRDEAAEPRLHRQLAAYGAGVAAVGFALGAISLPPAIAFWTGAWGRFLAFVGLMTLGVWIAWVWLRSSLPAWSSAPLLLFGRTSLFVYWVHVELAYGFLSYPLHHALPLPWSIVGFAIITAGMLRAARWWADRPKGTWIPEEIRASN